MAADREVVWGVRRGQQRSGRRAATGPAGPSGDARLASVSEAERLEPEASSGAT